MTGGRPLTGRKVLGIAVGAFAVIVGANLTLAWFAVGTFSGLVVDNSYIASQSFDTNRRAQEALGWTLGIAHAEDRFDLRLTDTGGATVRPATLEVMVGRPTSARTDQILALEEVPGGYAAPLPLAPGNWMVVVTATAEDGTAYYRRESLFVPDRP